jgi:hypothetical protein
MRYRFLRKRKNALAWNYIGTHLLNNTRIKSRAFVFVINLSLSLLIRACVTTTAIAAATIEFLAFDSWALFFSSLDSALGDSLRALSTFSLFHIFCHFSCCHRSYTAAGLSLRENVIISYILIQAKRISASTLDMHFFFFFYFYINIFFF